MIEGSTVLVTGGCGFIGVNLAELLLTANCKILAFDDFSTASRKDGEEAGFHVIQGDIRDFGAVREAARGVDYIVHLAAHTDVVESVSDPSTDLGINVDGTLNVLIAARDSDVKGFVFASSNAPLGETEPPSSEERVPRPLSPYGASKLAGEALCSAFSGSYGLPSVSLRFSNVYGPFSYHKGSVVAAFMKRVIEGQPLIVYGDGRQTRDFVYVVDLVDGIMRALDYGGSGDVFHLGSGTETSVNGLVEIFQEVFSDREVEIKYEPRRPGEIERNYSDISKARSVLGFEPLTDLEQGLRMTRAWFELGEK